MLAGTCLGHGNEPGGVVLLALVHEDLEDVSGREELGHHDALRRLVGADLVDGRPSRHPEGEEDRAPVTFHELLAGNGEVLETRHGPPHDLETLPVSLARLQLIEGVTAEVESSEHGVHDSDTVHGSHPARNQGDDRPAAAQRVADEEEATVAWDFSTEPEFAEQLAWIRQVVRDELIPLETLQLSPSQLRRALAPVQEEAKRRGLWAAHLPPELGGEGFGQVKLGLMHEILGQTAYGPVAFGNNAPDSGNAELIAIGIKSTGREEQRAQWLEPLLAGEIRSAFSMTEPGAGADPTLLATRAVRDGDEWVINGHKWFTSNGSVADVLVVMAVTNPDVHPYQGSSMILVPTKTPGVDIVRDVATMEDPVEHFGKFGAHSEVIYREVRVPYGNLVGNEGDGFRLAQQRLGPGRIHHCMRWLGQSQRAFDMLCERAVSRFTHGSYLAEKQTVQNWVADSMAEMTAARLMTLQAAWKMDTEGPEAARVEIALIKFYGAQVLYNVIDRAIQVHGSLGFSTDMPLEHMYRAARAARIYDGPDEVHRVTVARQVLKRYGRVEVPSEHVPTRREAAQRKFADLLDDVALEG